MLLLSLLFDNSRPCACVSSALSWMKKMYTQSASNELKKYSEALLKRGANMALQVPVPGAASWDQYLEDEHMVDESTEQSSHNNVATTGVEAPAAGSNQLSRLAAIPPRTSPLSSSHNSSRTSSRAATPNSACRKKKKKKDFAAILRAALPTRMKGLAAGGSADPVEGSTTPPLFAMEGH